MIVMQFTYDVDQRWCLLLVQTDYMCSSDLYKYKFGLVERGLQIVQGR